MKKITSLREETILYFVYFADHYLEDDEFDNAQCMPFDTKEKAIGAAMALLSVVKKVEYACVCKITTPIDDEEVEGQFIWEATAEDAENDANDTYDKSLWS